MEVVDLEGEVVEKFVMEVMVGVVVERVVMEVL